jgi:P-type conjugative transfer ATPase TrbB
MMADRSNEIANRHAAAIRDHLGELINGLLSEPDTTDLILNPPLPGERDGRIWVTRLGRDREPVGFMSAEQAIRLIGAIASTMNRAVTAAEPRIEGHLITDGSRFLGGIPPVAKAPFFCIRKPASQVFTLADYVDRGQMRQRQRDVIEVAIARRLNIIVSGGTGSGKTTLLNGIIRAMTDISPTHRFFGIEEVPELQCVALDQTFVQTTDSVSIRDLVRTAMRAFADRILIGEARGGEMLDILQVYNTGHPGGAATLHSDVNTPSAALERIEDMISMATNPPAMPQRMIARTVGLIVCLEVTAEKQRRIRQIVSVKGYDRGTQNYITEQED